MTAKWKRAEFKVRTPAGMENTVIGLVKGPFGMDRRYFTIDDEGAFPGWMITHLKTGYTVRGIEADARDVAERIADKLIAVGWDFDVPEESKSRAKAVKEIMDAEPACVRPINFLAPFFLEALA